MEAYRFRAVAENGIIALPKEFANKFVEIMICEVTDNPKQSDSIGEKRRTMYGCMKGKAWIADDFDEPLEELGEYMG